MSTIKLLRSSSIYSDLSEALHILKNFSHISGQPVILYYYLDEEKTKIDCLFALGINDGVGEDCYSIVSSKSEILIDRVILGELPDIMEFRLDRKEIFLCNPTESETNYWVTVENEERILTEVKNTNPILIKDISTGELWWVNNKTLKKCSDFPTEEEFIKLSDKTLKLEQSNQDILLPTQEKHGIDISLLMEKVYPPQIKISRDDVEVFEVGTTKDIELNVTLENRGVDITDECTWEVRKKSINDNIQEIINPREVILSDCNYTETFVFKAKHPDLGEFEKEYKAIFTMKTFIGKVKYPNSENLGLIDFYTKVGNGLPWNDDNFKVSDVINSIIENNEEEKRILRKEDEDIIYSNSFKIDEYLFIAIPKTHKLFSNIIDNTTGYSILNDFDVFGVEEDLELIRDDKGNKGEYCVYVRKHGVHSMGEIFSITFKP